MIAGVLDRPQDMLHLLLTNRRFKLLLTRSLQNLALRNEESCAKALCYYFSTSLNTMIKQLLEKGPSFSILLEQSGKQEPTILHTAPGKCEDGATAELLKCKSRLLIKDSYATLFPLERVVDDGRLSVLKMYVSEKDAHGQTALHLVAKSGNTTLAKTLLGLGADVNAQCNIDTTPLHHAVKDNTMEIVELLVEHGADTTIEADRSWFKHTPVYVAKSYAYDEALELMLSKGVSGNPRFLFRNGSTSLHLAVNTGNPLVVKAVLEKSAEVNTSDDCGKTPLHNAAMRGPEEIIEILLDHGACIDTKDFGQNTPLQLATWNHRTLASQILLERSAYVDCQDHSQTTPLHQAIDDGGSKELIKLLTSHFASIDIQDKCGNTALHLAARRGDVDVLDLLLTSTGEADLNLQSIRGETPLHVSARHGHAEATSRLLSASLDAKVVDQEGNTAVGSARKHAHLAVTRILLEEEESV